MEPHLISIESRGDRILAVAQCTRMDEDAALKMHEGVSAAAAAARNLPVVLDLSSVDFLPSRSLGVLVDLHQQSKEQGQRFIIVGVQTPVRDTIALTRLDKLFEIRDSVDDALV